MYAKYLAMFENVENLGGKAWQHAVSIDFLEQQPIIKDCSIHCFHYQQMFEMLCKHILETKSEDRLYSHTHKLNKLLEELLKYTDFKTDKDKYSMALSVITICAEVYRYSFLIECNTYNKSVLITNELLKELLAFINCP